MYTAKQVSYKMRGEFIQMALELSGGSVTESHTSTGLFDN